MIHFVELKLTLPESLSVFFTLSLKDGLCLESQSEEGLHCSGEERVKSHSELICWSDLKEFIKSRFFKAVIESVRKLSAVTEQLWLHPPLCYETRSFFEEMFRNTNLCFSSK